MEILTDQQVQPKYTIYKITDNITQRCYIGSTTMKLSIRVSMHKALYRQYQIGQTKYASAFEIIQSADIKTEALEELQCTKQELRKKEGEYIKNTENTVNRNIAGRTLAEYQRDHKEKCREYAKKSYQKNRLKRIAYGIAYYKKKKLEISQSNI